MEGSILVVDNFFDSKVYDNLAEFLGNEPMHYGSRSNSKTDAHGHWSTKLTNAGTYNLADISNALEDNKNLRHVNAAWKSLRSSGKVGATLIRCYVNGYTYGVDGYFHRDSLRSDEHTAILYVNDQWEPDWAGETVFLNENREIVKAVLPKRNRLVIFPSNMMHAGRGVSRKCTILRKTLIYKTRKLRTANFEKLSDFLRKIGATKYKHAKGTLHDHLVRTYSMLEKLGVNETVCFAAGLHAVYGTNHFRHSVITRREKMMVVDEFGEKVEHLVNLFSLIQRPGALNSPVALNHNTAVVQVSGHERLSLPRGTFDDLRIMECANLQDQNSLEDYAALHQLWGRLNPKR